ncbi:hydroxyisourate hydrolase [Novosphingobium rosa]|uniref:hydroxyisourate hydrolase n=1 Tax=Novosphingobium rosa TaxID=76978 RepID=UPI0008365D64|nr:hydroxyisourate hydrolase [Novosphingobium rosa]
MSSLSTHVLDTVNGRPAPGIRVVLTQGETWLAEGATDADGRFRGFPALSAGAYVLTFHVGDYFRTQGAPLADPPFLDVVPIHFGAGDEGHYHVPLLVSPFAFSTYRGS